VSQITEGQDGILEDAQECCGEGDKTKEKEDDVARERERVREVISIRVISSPRGDQGLSDNIFVQTG